MAANLQCSLAAVRACFNRREQFKIAGRIISGCEATPDGEPYAAELVQYVWRSLQDMNTNPALTAALIDQKPSLELMRRIFWGGAVTISGRMRGHVGYTERANTPFQGLAADGAKLALFRLLQAGFRLCGFVHDEMLVLIPKQIDSDAASQQVQQILIDSMQELTPDVPITCEMLLADRWYKQ